MFLIVFFKIKIHYEYFLQMRNYLVVRHFFDRISVFGRKVGIKGRHPALDLMHTLVIISSLKHIQNTTSKSLHA